MQYPLLVLYSPLLTLLPLNVYVFGLSSLYLGIVSLSKKLAFDVYDFSCFTKLIPYNLLRYSSQLPTDEATSNKD